MLVSLYACKYIHTLYIHCISVGAWKLVWVWLHACGCVPMGMGVPASVGVTA